MMTSAQVVETSVTTTDNSPSLDYTHLDDQTTLLHFIHCHTLQIENTNYLEHWGIVQMKSQEAK